MLEIINVSKTFNKGTVNEKKALDRLCLKIEEGDFITVIGGNGAGKSTMLNMIAGVYRIDFFAGHVANVEEDAWQLDFLDNAEFDKWIKYLKDTSAFQSDIDPQYGDKIFTLSTCSYEFDDARFILTGKLTKIE